MIWNTQMAPHAAFATVLVYPSLSLTKTQQTHWYERTNQRLT